MNATRPYGTLTCYCANPIIALVSSERLSPALPAGIAFTQGEVRCGVELVVNGRRSSRWHVECNTERLFAVNMSYENNRFVIVHNHLNRGAVE